MRQVFRPLSSLLLFLSTLIFSLSVVASESIETEDGQSSLYREIFERLASRHYRSQEIDDALSCLLYTSPSPRDRTRSRMPSSA